MPGHRAYFCLSDPRELLTHIGQSNGIQVARTSKSSHGSFSPQAYTATIITSKSWCIDRLYPHLESHRPCRSHRSRFVPTRLAHAHTWWICSVAAHHTVPSLIFRHESPLFSPYSRDLADFPFFALYQHPAFTSGIVLLLNIWAAKRSGDETENAREMEAVHKCMAVLKAAEGRCVRNTPYVIFISSRLILSFRRWHAAGRLWCVNGVERCVFTLFD